MKKHVLSLLAAIALARGASAQQPAAAAGSDDLARIKRLPVVLASTNRGHGGTLHEPNDGSVAALVSCWLGWQRGDRAAAASFTGPDCGYRRGPA